MCIYIYMYVYIYTHIHVYIYIYIYICVFPPSAAFSWLNAVIRNPLYARWDRWVDCVESVSSSIKRSSTNDALRPASPFNLILPTNKPWLSSASALLAPANASKFTNALLRPSPGCGCNNRHSNRHKDRHRHRHINRHTGAHTKVWWEGAISGFICVRKFIGVYACVHTCVLSYVKCACQCFQTGVLVHDDLSHASTLECTHANHTHMAIDTCTLRQSHTLHADRKIDSQPDTRIDTETHQNVLNGSKIHEWLMLLLLLRKK